MSSVGINGFFNTVQPLEIYFKGRVTNIDGYNAGGVVQDLFDSVEWFRMTPGVKVSEEEKLLISSRYEALARRLVIAKQPMYLSLRHFLPELSPAKPRRVGLEAEYARNVRAPESSSSVLKYDQRVGSILTSDAEGNKILAQIKLDGITLDEKSAILELEFRPFSLDSKEFSQQLLIIDNVRKAILGAEKGSSVQMLLDTLGQESMTCEIRIEKENPLVFDSPFQQLGPLCQVTVELPLSRLGDPADKAILELIEKPTERKLLQHARVAAEALVNLMRSMAAKLHGNIYEMNSIKLAKLRGYWAQSVMQACQVIHYDKDKERVGFHIRAAGPYQLGAREKVFLKTFFDRQSPPSELPVFKETLERSLKEGVMLLAEDGRQSKNIGINYMTMVLMVDSHNFEPRALQFKVGSCFSTTPNTLEFAYGMTLVELRHVRSSLNRGIMEGNAEVFSRIRSAQALPESRPRKALNLG